MNYCLRDYQEESAQKVFTQWAKGSRRTLLQLPTGAGKTVIFSSITKEFIAKGEGVLVIAHREELIDQAVAKLEEIAGFPVGVIKAGRKTTPLFPIQVASVQTIARRRRELWPQAGLIIIDEAHHAIANTYKQVIDHYPDAYILGVTATPTRTDGQGLKEVFDSLVIGKSVQWLIEKGHLSSFKIFAAPNRIKTDGIEEIAGDYNEKKLAKAASEAQIMGDLVECWQKWARGKRTIVFGVNVAHSQAIICRYLEAGIPAEHVDGTTPTSQRQAIFERFRRGQTLVLSNVGIAGEGIDIPAIEAIQCVRPTKSLTLWLQQLGRVLRPSKGKEHAIIIDHTTNWFDHNLPDEDRQWSLEPRSMQTHSLAFECPECNHIFRPFPHEIQALKATCPNCGVMVDIAEAESNKGRRQKELVEDLNAQLEEVELTPRAEVMVTLWQLRQEQQQSNYHPMWVYYRLIERCSNINLGELRECAKMLGYKSGWAWHCWRELQTQGMLN